MPKPPAPPTPPKPPSPEPTDFSQFTDEQLAMLLNVVGQARWLAMEELAKRHPITDPALASNTAAQNNT